MQETEKQLFELADKELLPHGLLLSGKDQLHLKELAQKLAQKILCVYRPESHPDFIYINSYQVEDIRRLLGVLSLKSFGNRVVVIENAEELTTQAVNNMLKKIEEPSDKTFYIILTGHQEKLLPTLRSRLMPFSFGEQVEESQSSLAGQFLANNALEARLKLVKDVDPHEEDLQAFLTNLYKEEVSSLGQQSAQRLQAILRSFELLSANVQANRVLAWLAVKWD